MNASLLGVGFGTAIARAFSKYAVFQGRASRSEYWWFALFTTIVTTITNALAGGENAANGYGFFGIVNTLVVLALILPSLAVAVRRLHDTNRSGWFILLGLIPLVGLIILIVFYATASDPNENRFGPAPVPVSAS